MPTPDSIEHVKVIGSGLVGSMLSIYLARRGYDVEVFERRPDMRKETIRAGRSINLALSTRGIHALERLGLAQEVLAQAIPMKGRVMHATDGALSYQPLRFCAILHRHPMAHACHVQFQHSPVNARVIICLS